MKNDYLKEALRSVGLSERELGVYLAILKLGKGTVTQITRKAGINRTTGYDILDALVAKGVVSISGKEPKQEYLAENPGKIIAYLKDKIAKDQERLAHAEKLVPELEAIYNVAGRPSVRFYEGEDGLRQVYEDTLTSHETIRAYATVDDMHQGLPDYFPEYYQRRAGADIAIRAIVPATEIGKDRAVQDKAEKRETALVPADKYYFHPEINIYDNKVMIASWREKLGIIIESEEIADAMKKVYELAWAEAKRLDSEIKEIKNPPQESL
jgi:sugar-specific transcriptional regulator TrmB